MSLEKELDSVESVLQKLPENEAKEASRILFGTGVKDLEVSEKCLKLVSRYKMELIKCKFDHKEEQLRPARLVRVALFQQKLPVPLTFPIYKVKTEMYTMAMDALKIAAKGGANVFCFQQAWNMPYAFCSGESMPWSEYAEKAEEGATTRILQTLAVENNMVIISTILERDENFEDRIWNTSVVIDNHGIVLGKQRRNHVPAVENSNEPTYYCEGDLGHPVFETEFGRIGVNICYERHYPLCWLALALNGAEIVVNPCGALGPEAEVLWNIEARNAAIANGYFVCAVNRTGMEIYEHEYEDEQGNIVHHRDSGAFFGSSYVSAPNGSRSPGLSRTKTGVLIAEFDLNLCRQEKDKRGLGLTHRLPLYKDFLSRITSTNFVPQVVKKHCQCQDK